MAIQFDDLPERLRELAQQIGLAPTLALVEDRGGTRIYIPVEMTPEHGLARRLGFAAAAELSRCYAGETLEIPRAAGALRALRDRRIVARLDEGASAALLAREFALTERGIWKIRRRLLREAPRERRQIDLFSGAA